eukprot:755806-Hanusia_phi.AAC.2
MLPGSPEPLSGIEWPSLELDSDGSRIPRGGRDSRNRSNGWIRWPAARARGPAISSFWLRRLNDDDEEEEEEQEDKEDKEDQEDQQEDELDDEEDCDLEYEQEQGQEEEEEEDTWKKDDAKQEQEQEDQEEYENSKEKQEQDGEGMEDEDKDPGQEGEEAHLSGRGQERTSNQDGKHDGKCRSKDQRESGSQIRAQMREEDLYQQKQQHSACIEEDRNADSKKEKRVGNTSAKMKKNTQQEALGNVRVQRPKRNYQEEQGESSTRDSNERKHVLEDSHGGINDEGDVHAGVAERNAAREMRGEDVTNLEDRLEMFKEGRLDCSVSRTRQVVTSLDRIVANFPYLQALSLRGQKISNLQPLCSLLSLRDLDVSSNDLHDISDICGCLLLQKLDLSNNKIKELPTVMNNLAMLRTLLLSRNRISFLTSFDALAALPSLAEISVAGNPVCRLVNCKEYILGVLRHLKIMDGTTVLETQRQTAAIQSAMRMMIAVHIGRRLNVLQDNLSQSEGKGKGVDGSIRGAFTREEFAEHRSEKSPGSHQLEWHRSADIFTSLSNQLSSHEDSSISAFRTSPISSLSQARSNNTSYLPISHRDSSHVNASPVACYHKHLEVGNSLPSSLHERIAEAQTRQQEFGEDSSCSNSNPDTLRFDDISAYTRSTVNDARSEDYEWRRNASRVKSEAARALDFSEAHREPPPVLDSEGDMANAKKLAAELVAVAVPGDLLLLSSLQLIPSRSVQEDASSIPRGVQSRTARLLQCRTRPQGLDKATPPPQPFRLSLSSRRAAKPLARERLGGGDDQDLRGGITQVS